MCTFDSRCNLVKPRHCHQLVHHAHRNRDYVSIQHEITSALPCDIAKQPIVALMGAKKMSIIPSRVRVGVLGSTHFRRNRDMSHVRTPGNHRRVEAIEQSDQPRGGDDSRLCGFIIQTEFHATVHGLVAHMCLSRY